MNNRLDKYLFNLQLESVDMDVFFAHKPNANSPTPSSVNYSILDFYRFLGGNQLSFIIRNVELKNEDYLIEYPNGINQLIDRLGQTLENSANYLAVSPDQKTSIIVRNIEIVTFPKYFENWTCKLVYGTSTADHIWGYDQWYQNFEMLKLKKWKLIDVLLTTLHVNIVMRADNTHPSYNALYNDLDSKGLLKYYLDSNKYHIERLKSSPWEEFAFHLYDNFVKNHCTQKFEFPLIHGYCFEQYCTIAKTGYDTRLNLQQNLDQIQQFKQFYSNTEFFPYHFNTLQKQKVLFKHLPFDLTERKAFNGYHYS